MKTLLKLQREILLAQEELHRAFRKKFPEGSLIHYTRKNNPNSRFQGYILHHYAEGTVKVRNASTMGTPYTVTIPDILLAYQPHKDPA